MTNRMKEIIFFAPIGKGTPPERIGGAEAGCLKTMKIYENEGIEVIHLDRPVSKGGILKYIMGMLLAPIKMFFLLLCHHSAVVHVVGFYHRTVGQEKLLVMMSKMMGHKVIYEPRNGSMVISYYEGNDSYRKKLSYLLCAPDVVLCQGMEYINMIKKIFGLDRSYYPNYIMDEFVQPNKLERGNQIKLLYFGRVVPEKNVDVVIKTAALLKQKGYDVVLDIIGGCSADYLEKLNKVIAVEKMEDIVFFHGRKPFSFIADVLHKSHYYIFPSAEANEGHSNSLTEAMGCGVVPIVSKAGFNESICGNSNLVADDLFPETYASIVENIEHASKWKYYSSFCYDRVVNNYTQSIVSKKLIDYVTPLFD